MAKSQKIQVWEFFRARRSPAMIRHRNCRLWPLPLWENLNLTFRHSQRGFCVQNRHLNPQNQLPQHCETTILGAETWQVPPLHIVRGTVLWTSLIFASYGLICAVIWKWLPNSSPQYVKKTHLRSLLSHQDINYTNLNVTAISIC